MSKNGANRRRAQSGDRKKRWKATKSPRIADPRCKKRRYPNEGAVSADLAIIELRRNQRPGSTAKRKESAYYHCPTCDGWHMTKQGKGNKSASSVANKNKSRPESTND